MNSQSKFDPFAYKPDMLNKKGRTSKINSLFSSNPFIKKKQNTLIATPSKFAIRKTSQVDEKKAENKQKEKEKEKSAGIREKLKKQK
jgi:hypothetical protein